MRSRSLAGFDAPYVPGWDCHGLPIELQVDKDLGSQEEGDGPGRVPPRLPRVRARSTSTSSARSSSAWASSATGRIPYLTMAPGVPGDDRARAGRRSSKQRLVYKAKKSVHWCISCRTALAEAEVEYDESHVSPSIDVRYPLRRGRRRRGSGLPATGTRATRSSGPRRPGRCPRTSRSPSIPTRTTAFYAIEGTPTSCCSRRRSREKAQRALEREGRQRLGLSRSCRAQGRRLRGRRASAIPGLDRDSARRARRLRHARHRHRRRAHGARPRLGRLPDGRALRPRHLLPGRRGGPLHCPRSSTSRAQKVFDANPKVDRAAAGAAARCCRRASETHSYPVCWRCKNPIIFRATRAVVHRLDGRTDLRERALHAIENVQLDPAWGATASTT